MKKSLMIFAASTMLLFAACNKEENNGYSINGDKITFGMGIDNPQDEGKQSFNGEYKRIYFTTGDMIYVNDVQYAVNPTASDIFPGSNASFSPVAQVTCNVASTGAYAFTYPANIFTVDEGVYRATFPSQVLALNGNHYDNNIESIREDIRPIWPMYFGISDISTFNGQVNLKNACAFLSPNFIYGPAWANVVFSPLTGVNYGTIDGTTVPCPILTVADGVIYTNQKLHGAAHLDVTNPDSPMMVMDAALAASGYDTLSWGAPANTIVTENSGTNQELLNVAGIIPIAPIQNFNNKTFKMAVALNTTIGETTYYLLYVTTQKSVTTPMERNKRYMMNINFQTVGEGTTGNYTYEGGLDAYTTNNGGHIHFVGGDLYVCNNLTDFGNIINTLNIYPL